MRSARRGRALRVSVLLAVTALTAALVPSPVQAGTTGSKSLIMSQTFEFDGQKWRETIIAMDGGSDSVWITLAKVSKKSKDGKLVYNLRESQQWSFSGLDANTIQINSDLTASIDMGDQHPLFDADIDLKTISGKGIQKFCNGNIKRRVVEKTGGSSMSLKTGNSVFRTVKWIPKRATVTTDNGKCAGSGGGGHYPCPTDGAKSVSGFGFMPDGSYLSWAGNLAGGSYAQIHATIQRALGDGGTWSAMLSGKVVKSRVVVANDLSKGSVDGTGLPRLKGKGTVNADETNPPGTWYPCGKNQDKESRQTSKSGTQGGNLTFTPTGADAMSSDQEFSSEWGSTTKTDVRNRK
jgi:hypothetical protein